MYLSSGKIKNISKMTNQVENERENMKVKQIPKMIINENAELAISFNKNVNNENNAEFWSGADELVTYEENKSDKKRISELSEEVAILNEKKYIKF